jgi:predicted Zn-dependent protease
MTKLLTGVATLPLIMSLIFQAGCSLQAPRSEKQPAIDPVTHQELWLTDLSDPQDFGPAPDESGINPKQFSQENLLTLLTAELAAKRQQYDLVLDNYLAVARTTRDEGVITRAFGAAQFLKNEEAFAEMTLLWADIAPDNIEVQQQAAFELIKARRLPEALTRMERVLELEGPTSFDRVAVHAKVLSEEERTELLRLYQQILARHPDNGELRYGYAVLQELNNQPEQALATAQALLVETPENAAVITLCARLLKITQGSAPAITFLKTREKLLLADAQLGNFYARALIDSEKMREAQNVYKKLADKFPEATHLRLSYALVALENKQTDTAKATLNALIKDGHHTNEAHFYLARIAEQEEDIKKAIAEYQLVERGGNYFNALARAAYLLIQTGQEQESIAFFEQARQQSPAQAEQIWELQVNLMVELERTNDAMTLATRALDEFPDSHSLLYARAMLYERLDNIVEMESDLRSILEEDPNNPVALNALGYTLADRTGRKEEAYNLIRKAYALDPENPAIIDSLGWVLFQTNKIDEALPYLEKAYAKFPDPEVGAHLAEVLWTNGQKDAALQIFQENYDKDPEHRILNKTLDRLGIKLSTSGQKTPALQ